MRPTPVRSRRTVQVAVVAVAVLAASLATVAPTPATADTDVTSAVDADVEVAPADADVELASGTTETVALALRPSVRAVGDLAPPVLIHGGGWGHGVGMSQYGAYAMALAGRDVAQILGHYYPGTAVASDDRSSQRIRVGLLTARPQTTLTAVDGPVPWLACEPETPEQRSQRVPSERCEPWFDQQAGTTAHVVADDDAIRVSFTTGSEAVGTETVGTGQVSTATVVRADHGDVTIRADSHTGDPRSYRGGWRDIHHLDAGLTVVQDLASVETYLRGLAEAPNSWGLDGAAALEAQAVTGRTFALRRLDAPRGGTCACDLLATPADQAYIGEDKVLGLFGELWAAAVEATAGTVLTYDGALAETYYSSSHAGRTEAIEDSWAYGTTAVPYLRSVDDPWSVDPASNNPYARWTATVDNAALATFLSQGLPTPIARVERLTVLDSTAGGTPRNVEVVGVTATGQRVTATFAGRTQDAKPIAGASLRRFLPMAAGDGVSGGRLRSSQIERFGFAPFTDDDGHTHEATIVWAHAAGIVRGIDDTRFAPDRAVTRAQLATYLANTFAVPVSAPTGRFDDVPRTSTHAANIEALALAGVVNGYPDGTFRPGQPVTREQFASLLASALALSPEGSRSFDDVGGGAHAGAISAIAAADITGGCDVDRFCPTDPVSRGQLTAFLNRAVLR